MTETVHIVFDGPPGPTAPRFIECERPDGTSFEAGVWREKADGRWELVIGQSLGAEQLCPICLKPIHGHSLCLFDVTEGVCHAACLEGSTVVDLETQEPTPDQIPPTPFRFDSLPQPKDHSDD